MVEVAYPAKLEIMNQPNAIEVAEHWGSFGTNSWLVEEKYEQYLQDPDSVGASWQEFFDDFRRSESPNASVEESAKTNRAIESPKVTTSPAAQVPQVTSSPNADSSKVKTSPATEATPQALPEEATILRGAAARIAANMTESLSVPTATSIRPIPAKLLEVNRELLNRHLARTLGGKVSFTHIIGYAVVKAVGSVPAMNARFVPSADGNGQSGVVRSTDVGLGIAVDVEKSDGSRTLMVPCIKAAQSLSFKAFVRSYEDLIRKVRSNKLSVDDFSGVTITLTNPGTLGTAGSVPRLMPGQGAIVATGSIGYPVEFGAADPKFLASLGISKTITLTSTYDHRIIQGAESGIFLSKIADLLLGSDGFYEEIFRSMGAQFCPFHWSQDLNPATGPQVELLKQIHVGTLINMYRVRGHLIANLDPLADDPPKLHSELDPGTYGLTLWDLDREFLVDNLAGRTQITLGAALGILRDAYCQSAGVEYMHIQEPDQKRWIQAHVEGIPTSITVSEQLGILEKLNAAEAFEKFLHSRYIGQKRFGLEGGESAIALLAGLLDEAGQEGIDECLFGMAHRGRLNVMVNIVGKSYTEMFDEFEGNLDPETVQGSGDVKYHKGCEGIYKTSHNKDVRVYLAANPSHLEAVDPVSEGMVRAHQDLLSASGVSNSRDKILPVVIHGDAAFAGQGVVAETLNLSNLPGYSTGGTIHLVINNQVGFTTDPTEARSSVYPTDVAKMVQAPIFHVNGDDPEACVRVGKLAFAFRQAFHKDVVIDMWCYRRYGHNEGDEPSYTQPQMYEKIDQHRSVRKIYTETLIRRGDITMEEAEKSLDDFQSKLQFALEETRSSAPAKLVELPKPKPPEPLALYKTSYERAHLDVIAESLTRFPDGFSVHPKLASQFASRQKLYSDGIVDWSLGEAFAYGSLLADSINVRLSGQDTRRGTFSHRHSVLIDYHNGQSFCPLGSIGINGAAREMGIEPDRLGRFYVFDSLLSEYAALGFEYGYSIGDPASLVIWEAQFGDFSNGAQTIIDEFIVSAGEKWDLRSGLVMLLPHGYEGQGPDHSSARLERFLQLCAEDNLHLVNPTTASQFFHLIRGHALGLGSSSVRPLIVMSPKSLLRAQQSRSKVSEFTSGSFSTVLDDTRFDENNTTETYSKSGVRRVVLCSGKIAFDALSHLERSDQTQAEVGDLGRLSANQVSVVRIEQLYPWPEDELEAILSTYSDIDQIVWLQDEPENMGAWMFVEPKLRECLGPDFRVDHVARRPSGSPATGSSQIHQLELQDLLRRTLD